MSNLTRTPLESTESAAKAIKRVSYSHDVIIDFMIMHPTASLEEIADYFGYSAAWLSRIRNSDAFNVVLARRRSELVDTTIVATIEENLRNVAQKSMEKVLAKLDGNHRLEDAIKAMDIATKALGYGARTNNEVNTNVNFVVALPDRSTNADSWLNTYNSNAEKVVNNE